MDTSTDSTAAQATSRLVYPPLQWWKVLLLVFVTLGLYGSFWLMRAARDLRAIDERRYQPWLWFLSPLIAISLPFSFYRLARRYHEIAGGRTAFPTVGILLGLFACLCGLAMQLSDRIEIPISAVMGLVLAWGGTFALMQVFINRIKETLPAIDFRTPSFRFTSLQRTCVGVGGLLTVTVIVLGLVYELGVPDGEAVADGRREIDSETGYSFVVDGEGWKRVAIGSLSDGTTELELQGRLTDMWALVFHYGPQESLDNLMQSRRMTIKESLSGAICTERRSLASDDLDLVATLKCQGRYITDPAADIVRIIETERGLVELYTHLSAPRINFELAHHNLNAMINSFEKP